MSAFSFSKDCKGSLVREMPSFVYWEDIHYRDGQNDPPSEQQMLEVLRAGFARDFMLLQDLRGELAHLMDERDRVRLHSRTKLTRLIAVVSVKCCQDAVQNVLVPVLDQIAQDEYQESDLSLPSNLHNLVDTLTAQVAKGTEPHVEGLVRSAMDVKTVGNALKNVTENIDGVTNNIAGTIDEMQGLPFHLREIAFASIPSSFFIPGVWGDDVYGQEDNDHEGALVVYPANIEVQDEDGYGTYDANSSAFELD